MRTHSLLLFLGFAIYASPTTAQLGAASARTLGMGGNVTAAVEEFGAIGVNPAGLAMPGSGFSLALVPMRANLGLSPVSWADAFEWQGVVVPTSVRSDWLAQIEASGAQRVDFGLDLTGFAMTLGSVGLQLSTVVSGAVSLPPDAAQLFLFGNAGRIGEPEDLNLAGFAIDGFALSTAAASFALPIGSRAAIGVTGKYILGHGVLFGEAPTGSFTSNPIGASAELPFVAPCDDEVTGQCVSDPFAGGTGFGIDVGFMADLGVLRIGAAAHDVLNTFAWDESVLSFRDGRVVVGADSTDVVFDERPISQAPASMRARLADMVIRPTVRAGVALDAFPGLTVTGDIQRRLGEGGMIFQPTSRMGVGAEFHGLGIVRLQGGAALITDGREFSGGLALVLGPLNLSGAASLRSGDAIGESTFAQVVLSLGGR
jgi:hypothetical protein